MDLWIERAMEVNIGLNEKMHVKFYLVDIISTTLSGYTPYTSLNNGPDFELIKKLSKDVPIPVIAEGMIEKPEDAVKCLKLGAFAIVVGGAITRPQLIAKKFVDAINKME